MRKVFLLGLFVGGNIAILILTIVLMSFYTSHLQPLVEAKDLSSTVGENSETYLSYALPENPTQPVSVTLVTADARAKLVDDFFKKYQSPLAGMGAAVVLAADKNGIPFGYIPAISGCESTFGKTLPNNSFNAWGYGIYGGQVKRFTNWTEAIDRVSRGLREDYFSKGLNTPETIMTKYTPPSQGSWASCVNQFLGELI